MSKRDAYQKKLEAQLDGWNADINKLKAKAENADAEARIKYYSQLDELKEKRNAASDKLDELKEASDQAWEDIKAGVESAWKDLDESVRRARSNFS